MIKLLYILPMLSSVTAAAHFSRAGNNWTALACLLLPLILFSRRRWVMRLFQLFLLGGGVIWLERMLFLVNLRRRMHMPWERLAVILGVVALFTMLTALVFQHKKIKEMFRKEALPVIRPALSASVLTFVLLFFVKLKVKVPVLLLMERFFPGSGWIEVIILMLYAGWITEKMMDPARTSAVRSRIWLVFSLLFFTQLILGVAGLEKLLMTGKLHLPVPAMIIAGPLFRGGGFFMLILFSSTVILLGPAWCSYLCYIGAWDNLSARTKKRPDALPKWLNKARAGIFLLIVVSALLLRWWDVSGIAATLTGATFGLMGVGIMALVSRKRGSMVHCISYCPIGLAANVLGKLNPFRLRITNSCTDCGACGYACRYDALSKEDIKNRKPGLTCTLCGDCISRCNDKSIHYSFPGLKPQTARALFIVTAVALHAVFLGVARL